MEALFYLDINTSRRVSETTSATTPTYTITDVEEHQFDLFIRSIKDNLKILLFVEVEGDSRHPLFCQTDKKEYTPFRDTPEFVVSRVKEMLQSKTLVLDTNKLLVYMERKCEQDRDYLEEIIFRVLRYLVNRGFFERCALKLINAVIVVPVNCVIEAIPKPSMILNGDVPFLEALYSKYLYLRYISPRKNRILRTHRFKKAFYHLGYFNESIFGKDRLTKDQIAEYIQANYQAYIDSLPSHDLDTQQ